MGTGTGRDMVVGGTGAEVGVSSGTWEGVRADIGGGASSQGASTHCPESWTLSAGGCTDTVTHKHTQTQLKTCIFQAIHESNNKNKKQNQTKPTVMHS